MQSSELRPLSEHVPRTLNMLYARLPLAYCLHVQPALKELLSNEQLSYLDQTDIGARCTLTAWHELMDLLADARHSADLIPELAMIQRPWRGGLLGQLFLSGPTVGDLLTLMEQVHPMLNDVFVVEQGIVQGRAFFLLRQTTHEGSDRLARLTLTHWTRLMKFFTDRWDEAVDACFEGPAPIDLEPYRRIFGGQVQFNQDQNAVFFDPRHLAIPVIYKDQPLHDLLKVKTVEQLEGTRGLDGLFTDRIRGLIRARLDNPISQHELAEALEVSSRTLQRRLQEQGLSLRTMIDGERRIEAQRCLKDTDVPLAELACMLGFTDLSAFSRAFRRWTGLSPSAFRAKERGP